MTTGETISLIAVCLSFLAIIISFVFNSKKDNRERDEEKKRNIENIAEIKNNVNNIKSGVDDIKYKVEKIDVKMQNDHDKLTAHETRIKNLEKEVFK